MPVERIERAIYLIRGHLFRSDCFSPGRRRGLCSTQRGQETTPQAVRLGGTAEAGVRGRRAALRPYVLSSRVDRFGGC